MFFAIVNLRESNPVSIYKKSANFVFQPTVKYAHRHFIECEFFTNFVLAADQIY